MYQRPLFNDIFSRMVITKTRERIKWNKYDVNPIDFWKIQDVPETAVQRHFLTNGYPE